LAASTKPGQQALGKIHKYFMDFIDFATISKMKVSMSALLAIVVLFLIALLLIWHRDSRNTVDLKDLICVDNKLDEKKFTRLGAWIVSTWGFVYLILDSKFTEWYFAGYMAIWVGNAIVDKYLNSKNPTQQQGASTRGQ
jgi:hypothetical protein